MYWQLHGAQSPQRFHQFVNRRFTQLRIRGMRHFSFRDYFHPHSAFGGESHAILRRLAIDQKSRSGSLLVRYPGALAIALLADKKKKPDFDSFQTQPLPSRNLCGDNAFGVASSSAINAG